MKYLIVFLLVTFSLQVSASEIYDRKVDTWLQALAVCESGGVSTAYVANDGGSESIGKFQYKRATFATYMKKFNAFVPKGDIWNPVTQEALARRMLLEPLGWKHWRNCALKIGLLPHMVK